MIKKLLIILAALLINNTTNAQDSAFISSVGKNIHDAQRKAMNAIRTHGVRVMAQHTEISSDGTAIVVIQVKNKNINHPHIYAKDDRYED